MVEQFRLEVRSWLEANCPPSMRTPVIEDEVVMGGKAERFKNPEAKIWFDRMVAKGWTAPQWPKIYGGAGLTPAEARVLREEMSRLNCRRPLFSFGYWMLGPVLLQYGTEEQKLEHLPKIARGEVRWCQGYSEPEAGSDLASLRTRAVLQGDQFIINGSKIWTSIAQESDWIFCLVRTDPDAVKQKGISFVLIDMSDPGVKVEPILLISGASPFCEVFFKDVRTPAKNLVGPLNGGWQIAKALLTHERLNIDEMGDRGEEQSLEDRLRQAVGTEGGKLADRGLRDRLAAYHMDNQAFRMTMECDTALQKAGHAPGAASSVFKWYGSELGKRKFELLMEGLGNDSLVWDGHGAPEDNQATRDWLRSKGFSIEGGTSEIQLNIIAKQVLGL